MSQSDLLLHLPVKMSYLHHKCPMTSANLQACNNGMDVSSSHSLHIVTQFLVVMTLTELEITAGDR